MTFAFFKWNPPDFFMKKKRGLAASHFYLFIKKGRVQRILLLLTLKILSGCRKQSYSLLKTGEP